MTVEIIRAQSFRMNMNDDDITTNSKTIMAIEPKTTAVKEEEHVHTLSSWSSGLGF